MSDQEREQFRRGLEDYHDPTAGLGGAPPARSALTLRLVLAGFGVVVFTVLAILAMAGDIIWLAVGAAVVAAIALIDGIWVLYRKRRGEPG